MHSNFLTLKFPHTQTSLHSNFPTLKFPRNFISLLPDFSHSNFLPSSILALKFPRTQISLHSNFFAIKFLTLNFHCTQNSLIFFPCNQNSPNHPCRRPKWNVQQGIELNRTEVPAVRCLSLLEKKANALATRPRRFASSIPLKGAENESAKSFILFQV